MHRLLHPPSHLLPSYSPIFLLPLLRLSNSLHRFRLFSFSSLSSSSSGSSFILLSPEPTSPSSWNSFSLATEVVEDTFVLSPHRTQPFVSYFATSQCGRKDGFLGLYIQKMYMFGFTHQLLVSFVGIFFLLLHDCLIIRIDRFLLFTAFSGCFRPRPPSSSSWNLIPTRKSSIRIQTPPLPLRLRTVVLFPRSAA